MLTKPLVIGTPRTGFSLLIQVVSSIEALFPGQSVVDPRQGLINRTVELSSLWMTGLYRDAFTRCGITDDLNFNGEFHLLVGGPKWLDKTNPERACFRRYFGVKGMGDFLLSTSHPRQVLDWYNVVHSHTAPGLWATHPHFGTYRRLASIRNPIGVINSACFSLNAVASEHVQRYLPEADETNLRQRLALYKLTDLEFVRGLVRFLVSAYDEYLACRDQYQTMRWEDLISRPIPTIQQVGGWLGRNVTAEQAARIWRPMDHVNTLEHHKHNFRAGKGIIGDWKNSLVQAHLDLFREHGFDRLLEALGYPPIPTLNPDDYTPFQKLIARHVERGEVYRSTGDADLFGYAFNKSNIDVSQFGFKSYPKRNWTHVERSTVTRDDVVEAVSDAAESGCEQVNRLLGEVLASANPVTAGRHVEAECRRLAAGLGESREKTLLLQKLSQRAA